MQIKINILRIIPRGDDYQSELALRDEVLRRPLGMSIHDDDLSGEFDEVHIGAFRGGKLIGVLILSGKGKTSVKMRQVAVNASFRGYAVGKRLVRFAEGFSAACGYRCMVLHARKTAVHFYETLGYHVTGPEFHEVTLPHLPMGKTLKTEEKDAG